MGEEYRIIYVDNPDDAVWEAIGGGISRYNKQQAGDDKAQRLCFVLHAPDETVVGGVIGVLYWDWLSIDLMWIKDELRSQGYGRRLLALIENEARQRGAKHAHLDTFSFQAPDFYKRHGYEVFGELTDFPPGHQRYYLVKHL